MGYIIKTVNVINVPGSSKVPADVAELADAHGSGPCAARLKGSTPFVGTIFQNGFGETLKGDNAGMAYRLCTSLPSWLEGFDPPYPLHYGGIPEWLKGADCKSAGTAFDGSNPSPTTIYLFNRL